MKNWEVPNIVVRKNFDVAINFGRVSIENAFSS